jgi:DNA-binding transcriptional MerR regulator
MARRTTQRRGPRSGRQITLVTRSALCVLSGISERRLAVWEREDLIVPTVVSNAGGVAEPLYDRAALIRTLEEELDVNLPGIGVILNLLEQFPR